MLLDLVLPELTGLDVLKRLRADPKRTNVVVMVLSARSFGDLPAALRQAGANEHCTKPIAPSTLLKKLMDLGVPPSGQPSDQIPTPGRGA